MSAPPLASLEGAGRLEPVRIGVRFAPHAQGSGPGADPGARLESLNKEYKTSTHIIISETTYLAAKDAVEVRRLGEVKVKGKTRPLVVYELVGMRMAEAAEPVPAALTKAVAPA